MNCVHQLLVYKYHAVCQYVPYHLKLTAIKHSRLISSAHHSPHPMLDFAKSVWRTLNINHNNPSSSEHNSPQLPISHLVPRWLADRDIASGDEYRRQGFSGLYGRVHGLRKDTFMAMNGVHQRLGVQRTELFEFATNEEAPIVEITRKSKTYKQKAKEFYKLVKGRTKGIPPQPINWNHPYSFIGSVDTSPESEHSCYTTPSNMTVNVACGSVSSHTGCSCSAPSESSEDASPDIGRTKSSRDTSHRHDEVPSPEKYRYQSGLPFLTVNVTAPAPSLCGSSTPSTPGASCSSCPPTPATANFDPGEIRVPLFTGTADEYDEAFLDQTSAWSDLQLKKPAAVPQMSDLGDQTALQQEDEVPLTQLGIETKTDDVVQIEPSSLAIDCRPSTPSSPRVSSDESSALSYWPPRPHPVPNNNALGLVERSRSIDSTVSSPVVPGISLNLRHLPSPPASPGEQLHRDNLVNWICRRVTIGGSHLLVLRTLPTDVLHHIMTEVYENREENGLRILEQYCADVRQEDAAAEGGLLGPLSPLYDLQPRPFCEAHAVQQAGSNMPATEYVGAMQLSYVSEPVRSPVMDAEPSYSHQPARKLTTDSDAYSTMLFNGNNSPIPRYALAARVPTFDASTEYIDSLSDDIQDEMATRTVENTNTSEIAQIGDVFRNEGEERGMNYPKRWSAACMRRQGSLCNANTVDGYSMTTERAVLPEYVPLTASSLSFEAAERVYSQGQTIDGTRGSDTGSEGASFREHFRSSVYNAEFQYQLDDVLAAAEEQTTNAAQSVESTTPYTHADAPAEAQSPPSSPILDRVERGQEPGFDALFQGFSNAAVTRDIREMAMWSLPGIQGGNMLPHLTTQARIWGACPF
ncbi:hypothetical protein BC835DRAFT_331145 [Cytidiella melzeri]|nr:hypothetical protein BC835DRAFT_331145 [Cytidiella melzeri]